MIIQQYLPEQFHREAAILYAKAFEKKFTPILGDLKSITALLQNCINQNMVFVALENDELMGLAGIQHDNQSFMDFGVKNFVKQYGVMEGMYKLGKLAMYFYRSQQKGELLMDGIVVKGQHRGKGIGTKLLESIIQYGTEKGFKQVRLDVVDTNPKAKKLYERMGFQQTQYTEYPDMLETYGFGAVSTMVRKL